MNTLWFSHFNAEYDVQHFGAKASSLALSTCSYESLDRYQKLDLESMAAGLTCARKNPLKEKRVLTIVQGEAPYCMQTELRRPIVFVVIASAP